jgi:hypothetical protein
MFLDRGEEGSDLVHGTVPIRNGIREDSGISSEATIPNAQNSAKSTGAFLNLIRIWSCTVVGAGRERRALFRFRLFRLSLGERRLLPTELNREVVTLDWN